MQKSEIFFCNEHEKEWKGYENVKLTKIEDKTSVADRWNFGTYFWLIDPDPDADPAIFVNDQGIKKKIIFFQSFFAYYLLKVHLHLKDKNS